MMKKLFANKINQIDQVDQIENNIKNLNSNQEDNPLKSLFNLCRFTGISFLGRKSLEESKTTKLWLLILEITSFLISNLLMIYWITYLIINPTTESIKYPSIGRFVLPAFLLNAEIMSFLFRFSVNYAGKCDRWYQTQFFLFNLINGKKSVIKKLKKVVKNITFIYYSFLVCLLVIGSINLFLTKINNPNLSNMILAIKFISYVYHTFICKLEVINKICPKKIGDNSPQIIFWIYFMNRLLY